MTQKAETSFIHSLHKHLPPGIYAEKMANPYRGGTPDVYYEAAHSSLWVEYKFIVLPKREDTWIKPALTALQGDWLDRNSANGHKPWVIVGHRQGGVIFYDRGQWLSGMPLKQFMDNTLPKKELALQIVRRLESP